MDAMMDYQTFFTRFAGSARTKHLQQPPGERGSAEQKRGKRRFAIPQDSELPKKFIRLCPWEMEYLFTVARRARKGILETGRFNGGSLFVMACAAPEGVPIHSIDIAPKDDARLGKFLERFCPQAKVELIVGDAVSLGDAPKVIVDAVNDSAVAMATIRRTARLDTGNIPLWWSRHSGEKVHDNLAERSQTWLSGAGQPVCAICMGRCEAGFPD